MISIGKLLQSHERWADRYLGWLALVLLGYALLGRGFAGVGIAQIYVGEITLILGCLLLPFSLVKYRQQLVGRRRQTLILELMPIIFLLLWILLGLVETGIGVSRFGTVALRDAAIWGYSVFSLIVFFLLVTKTGRILVWLRRYRIFVILLPIWIPIVQTVYWSFSADLPKVPDSDVTYFFVKSSDFLVHLAGIIAYLTTIDCGYLPSQIRTLWSGIAVIDVLILVPITRAGFFAFVCSTFAELFLRPHNRWLWNVLAFMAVVFTVAAVTGFEIYAAKGRMISAKQIAENALSVVGISLDDDTNDDTNQVVDTDGQENLSSSPRGYSLEGTMRWRLDWWKSIVDYTLFGEHFWFGKGFGVNLAESDGFVVAEFPGLRSPHNGHLTVLARMGVPGFALWMLFQAFWLSNMLRGYLSSRLNRELFWNGAFLFIIVYWVAFVINTSFDVYLEGPMGGIWFWCIIGLGMATAWEYSFAERPEIVVGDGSQIRSGRS